MRFSRYCIDNCRHCGNYKCRCESCFALAEENSKWYCDEYEEYCENISECGEFEEREEQPNDFIEIAKYWAIQDLGIEEYSDEWYELMDI